MGAVAVGAGVARGADGRLWLRVLDQEFVGVGDEIEERLEIGFVFPFVQLIIEGALFRVGLVLFFLLDQEFGRQYFPAEVAVVEGRIVDAFVEGLELGDGEFCRQ